MLKEVRLSRPFLSRKELTFFVILGTFFTVVITALLRFVSGGWTTWILFVPNVIIVLGHLFVVRFAAFRQPTKQTALLILVSSFLLVTGTLLQRDFGDGRGNWLVFMALFDHNVGDTGRLPSWWPLCCSPFWDLVLFIPLVISWVVLLLVAIQPKESAIAK